MPGRGAIKDIDLTSMQPKLPVAPRRADGVSGVVNIMPFGKNATETKKFDFFLFWFWHQIRVEFLNRVQFRMKNIRNVVRMQAPWKSRAC